MKILKSYATILILCLLAVSYSSCEKDSGESCEQQDMNQILNCGAETNVEVCCTTGAGCVYKYNGVEYPDTNAGLNNLADALGCTYKSSPNYDKEKDIIIEHLISLKDRAWSGVE